MNHNKAYKFGIEIEMGVPYEVDGSELQDAIEALGCNLTTDGSLSFDNLEPWEVTTQPLGYNQMRRTINKLGRYLASIEATANKSCGLHIHASNKRFFQKKNLLRITQFWLAIEDVLFATQPASRLQNHYCQRLLKRLVTGHMYDKLPQMKQDIIDEARGIDRYCAFNLNALSKHGTLEVRLFAGTTNPQKINAYLELIRGVYNYCLTNYDPKTVKGLFNESISQAKINRVWELLELSPKTKKLLNARIEKNMFKTLGLQQVSAIKYTEVQPKLLKARAKYEKYTRDYEQIRDSTQGYIDAFGGSY